jgi:hypothetical protein
MILYVLLYLDERAVKSVSSPVDTLLALSLTGYDTHRTATRGARTLPLHACLHACM